MRLKLKNTPEQVELIKAMGSKNQLVAREASEAFAAFLGPVIQSVCSRLQQQGPSTQMLLLIKTKALAIRWTCIITSPMTVM